MLDELSARQQAIRMRLAGEPVALICKVLKRSEAWVFKWWQRYVAMGQDGLCDLSRAHSSLVNRTPAHLERAVVSIRRRLAAQAYGLRNADFSERFGSRASIEVQRDKHPIKANPVKAGGAKLWVFRHTRTGESIPAQV